MKIKNILILIFLLSPIGAVVFAQGQNAVGVWEPVGQGIDFQHFQLTDPVPVNIFVARMDRDNPNATIESSIAQGRLSGGIETVSDMANRYDQALNNWATVPFTPTWGSRSEVVVAINGFYYGGTEEPPGVPWSGQIHSSWYAKQYTDDESVSGFVWKMDRSSFIGECVDHPDGKHAIYIVDDGDQYVHNFGGLNIPRGDDMSVLYTPQYDRDTNTANNGLEVLIEMDIPSSISVASDMPKGVIRDVRDNAGSTPIPFDHVVLSAHGTAASELRSIAKVGNPIAILQKVKDCVASKEDRWIGSYAGVGGAFYFLNDGEIEDYSGNGQANALDPRTAIAYDEDYIYFIVADGRDPGVSEGISIPNLASFTKNVLKATNGIAQDGGGSSTMVVNGRLVNRPFNPEWCEFIYIPLLHKNASSLQNLGTIPAPIQITPTADQGDTGDEIDNTDNTVPKYPHMVCERPVANGMMMVEVQPMEKSVKFSSGNLVATLADSDLFLGPGSNYGILSSIPSGTVGNVVANTKELDGVMAKNTYWWQVDFGGETAWIAEDAIKAQLKSAPAYWRDHANTTR